MKLDTGMILDVLSIGLMIIVGLMMFYYISKHLKEGVCGGYDQKCGCCGNETFTHKEITSNDLSKIAMGLSV